jgi:Uma2 family endonuclease
MKQGLEADECYYLTSEPLIRSKRIIDLTIDPPPDLAIEVENTVSAVDKLGIYATLKVPEVWRFDGEKLKIFALRADGTYEEKPTSAYFPAAASTNVAQWLEKCETMDETSWVKEFRRWVRENLTRAR